METKLEINVAEAVDTYYNLSNYNVINKFHDEHPSVVFTSKLRVFLIDAGVELK